MKYVLFIAGALIGQFIGNLITDNGAVVWGLSLVIGMIGYSLSSFIKYTRSSPKQLLLFHGMDSPLSRSKSRGELQTFFSQLHEGGLVVNFIPNKQSIIVNRPQWEDLTDEEKIAFLQIAGQVVSVEETHIKGGQDSQEKEIKVFDQNNELLKTYMQTK